MRHHSQPCRRAKMPAAMALSLALGMSLALSVAPPARAQKSPPGTKPASTKPASAKPATAKKSQTPAVKPAQSQEPVTLSPLKLLFAGKPLPQPAPEAAPYRDPADNAICVTPEALEPLGITYVIDSQDNKVTLITPDGAAATSLEPRTPPEGTPASSYQGVFIPLVETITALGGKCQFDPKTNTLSVRALLQRVEMLGGQLRVQASFPLLPTITTTDNGKKVILDFSGAETGSLPKILELVSPNLIQARSGQFQEDTARIVLELSQPMGFIVLGGKASTQMVMNPIPVEKPTVAAAPAPAPQASRPARPARAGKPQARPTAGPTVVSNVEFRALSEERAQFVVRAGRATEVRASQSDGRLILELFNAVVGPMTQNTLAEVKHPFLRAATLQARNGVAELAVDLTRIVTFAVKPDGKGNILLDLFMPKNAGGRLDGRLIVVDAGHGGHDRGAKGYNGTSEKEVTLKIATQLADQLREAGANVIMTRASDFYIKVNDRPRIANKAGADFFISVHGNDPGNGNRKINGSVVYYHGNDPSCRALAQSIAYRFERLGGIASKGIASDYRIYPGSGFGVLRNSRMVAVLIETGFMTNPNDIKYLTNPAYQSKIAGAILAGIRDYIEGNPDGDTRNNNPEIEGNTLNLPLETVDPEAPPAEIPVMP